MLSRAAERIYWTGRYLERAENTARIVQQYSHLLLDLPDEVGVEWGELVPFSARPRHSTEADGKRPNEAILDFLLAECRQRLLVTCSTPSRWRATTFEIA